MTPPSARWRAAGAGAASTTSPTRRSRRCAASASASTPRRAGRCTSAAIDRADGETLYVGRHAVWSADNDLLCVNWRAPAAEPFYTATERDPHGLARRRRLDIEDRQVLGFVDEPLLVPAARTT